MLEQLEYDATDERVAKFLGELSDLCKKYDMGIDACGCCSSPWIVADDRTYESLCACSDGTCSVVRPSRYPGTYKNLETGEVEVVETTIAGFTITRNGKSD